MFFLYNDITKPFSSGMELSKTYDSESLTISFPDWIGISYLGYSKSSAYFPQDGRYSDHWILTKSRLGLVEEPPIFCPTNKDVYLITSEGIALKILSNLRYVDYTKSVSALADDESNIYRIQLSAICDRSNWDQLLGVISK